MIMVIRTYVSAGAMRHHRLFITISDLNFDLLHYLPKFAFLRGELHLCTYQRLSYVELHYMPVRGQSTNTGIWMDQNLASGSISSFSIL
jgi:hypothetical protein